MKLIIISDKNQFKQRRKIQVKKMKKTMALFLILTIMVFMQLGVEAFIIIEEDINEIDNFQKTIIQFDVVEIIPNLEEEFQPMMAENDCWDEEYNSYSMSEIASWYGWTVSLNGGGGGGGEIYGFVIVNGAMVWNIIGRYEIHNSPLGLNTSHFHIDHPNAASIYGYNTSTHYVVNGY